MSISVWGFLCDEPSAAVVMAQAKALEQQMEKAMSILGERLLGVEIAKHMAKQRKIISGDDDLSGIGTAARVVSEQRQRAEKAEAEVERLRGLLETARVMVANQFYISSDGTGLNWLASGAREPYLALCKALEAKP